MTTKLYIDVIKEHTEPWHKKNNLSFWKKMVFMLNAPSHAARITTVYLKNVFARHGEIIQWTVCSSD